MKTLLLAVAAVLLFAAVAPAAEPIALPAPQMQGGMPLMEALKARQSDRVYSDKEIPDQVLSNLLWAAAGINRPESGKRTAPSAVNWQEVSVYVIQARGACLYDAKSNTLQPVAEGDLRALAGTQPFVAGAPLNLVYIADMAKIPRGSEEQKMQYACMDTGYISQNVYLFCASEGLNTVVRASVDKAKLGAALSLRPEQQIILAQTVGYPK
jgi:SagB-type dehydrogenase family enzyme